MQLRRRRGAHLREQMHFRLPLQITRKVPRTGNSAGATNARHPRMTPDSLLTTGGKEDGGRHVNAAAGRIPGAIGTRWTSGSSADRE